MGVMFDNLAKELRKASEALRQLREEFDWGEVRRRIQIAVKALEIEERDARTVPEKTDEELNLGSELVDFEKHQGFSLDWLIAGDLAPLLQRAADRRR